MASIAYYVHGRGRGHASRSRPIIRALREVGHEVQVFGGGHAAALLTRVGGFQEVPPVLPDAGGVLTWTSRTAWDCHRLRCQRPDLVVSDGDSPSIVAASLLQIPTLVVGHDLVFTRCQLPVDLPRRRLLYERLSAAPHSLLGRFGVAVHFLPIHAARPDTQVARPDCPLVLNGNGPVLAEDYVVCYFRDGIGARIAEWVARKGIRAEVFGPLERWPEGVVHRRFGRQIFAARLRRCAAVIGTAGSNLLAECIMLGKPVLALHAPDDHEQALNGRLAARAGVGMSASFQGVDEELVDLFLERVASRSFHRIDLALALPPVSQVMTQVVDDILGPRLRAHPVSAMDVPRPGGELDRRQQPAERPDLRADSTTVAISALRAQRRLRAVRPLGAARGPEVAAQRSKMAVPTT